MPGTLLAGLSFLKPRKQPNQGGLNIPTFQAETLRSGPRGSCTVVVCPPLQPVSVCPSPCHLHAGLCVPRRVLSSLTRALCTCCSLCLTLPSPSSWSFHLAGPNLDVPL